MAGAGQLLLAVAGFVMVVGWFVLLALQVYRLAVNGEEGESVARLGLAGGATFAAAWLWSLVTSISILREARANEPGNGTFPKTPRGKDTTDHGGG